MSAHLVGLGAGRTSFGIRTWATIASCLSDESGSESLTTPYIANRSITKNK
jgi:hypothetical protein